MIENKFIILNAFQSKNKILLQFQVDILFDVVSNLSHAVRSFGLHHEHSGIEPSTIDTNNYVLLTKPHMLKNLQQANFTGSGITSDMVSTFIKTINDAYTISGNKIRENAQQIQNKLEGSYTRKFEVLIFPENCTADLRIFAASRGKAVVTWSKVNIAQPAQSYIIINIGAGLQKEQIDGYYQKGSGMKDNEQKRIQNIIAKYETEAICQCQVSQVAHALEGNNKHLWNVVCVSPKTAKEGFAGSVYQRDGIYMQTLELTRGKCRYLVWVI